MDKFVWVLFFVAVTLRWWRICIPVALALLVGWEVSKVAEDTVWLSYSLLLGAAFGGGFWEWRAAVKRKTALTVSAQQRDTSAPLPFSGVRKYVCPNFGQRATTLAPRPRQGQGNAEGWACTKCGAAVTLAHGLLPFLAWFAFFLAVSTALGFVAGPYAFSILLVPGILVALWYSLQLTNAP